MDFRPLTLDRVGLHPENSLVWDPARDLPKPRAAMTKQVRNLDAAWAGLQANDPKENAICSCFIWPVRVIADAQCLTSRVILLCAAWVPRHAHAPQIYAVSTCTESQMQAWHLICCCCLPFALKHCHSFICRQLAKAFHTDQHDLYQMCMVLFWKLDCCCCAEGICHRQEQPKAAAYDIRRDIEQVTAHWPRP